MTLLASVPLARPWAASATPPAIRIRLRRGSGVSLGDSLASLHAVIGALMSLLRVKTGQGGGQIVDVSLAESVFNRHGKPGARIRHARPCA